MWDQVDDVIRVRFDQRSWAVEAGQTVATQIIIENGGDYGALFRLEVAELDATWVTLSPAAVYLEDGAKTAITMRFDPPRQPTTSAATYHFWLIVSSPDYPDRCCRCPATLTVRPYFAFSLGEVSPQQQRSTWFRPGGRVIVPVVNSGNTAATFQLEGTTRQQTCRLEFQSPLDETTLADRLDLPLTAGQTVPVTIIITPLARRLISPHQETHFCTITTRLRNQPQADRSILIKLQAEPLIGLGWLSFLTILLLLSLSLLLPAWLDRYDASFGSQWAARLDPGQNQAGDEGRPYDGRVIVVGEYDPHALPPGYMTYEEIFKEVAAQYNLDWRILAEQSYWESRLDPGAIGASQEMGLMQIYPTTWQEWSAKLDVTDPFDPYSNILVGAAYLAYCRDYFKSLGHSEAYWMLVAYNWGPNNLHQLLQTDRDWFLIPPRTRQYSLGILEAAGATTLRPELIERLQQQAPVQ